VEIKDVLVPNESGCVLLSHAHICALGDQFAKLGKMERGCQTIGKGFFSFCQKIKDGKIG
jgi:hypothetical protein